MTKPRNYDQHGLPRHLGDGLVLRWATSDDTEAVADFNARIHGSEPALDEPLRVWTREMMATDQHPTVRAADFLVVVDESKGGKLVSTLNLISQTWEYDGIPFAVGQPEIVGTEPDYRRRGLVRQQFDIIHARSAARGEMVQGITGIPWYYRQFGYAMALDLGGARRLYWHNLPKLNTDQTEIYRQRPARMDDLPLLKQLYAVQSRDSLVNRVRDEAEWYYELNRTDATSSSYRRFMIVEDLEGHSVGYYQYCQSYDFTMLIVREIAVLPGQSLRMVAEFVCRSLKAEADEINKEAKTPIVAISFAMGSSHAVYTALGRQLDRQIDPYAWFIRVPDLSAFLRHIGPVLEKRLATSPLDGYSGTFRLGFYRSNLTLIFDKGRLTDLGTFQATKPDDGDAVFPDLTFLEMLFGRRSFDDLRYAFPDCLARNEQSAILTNSLFPKQPSCVRELT